MASKHLTELSSVHQYLRQIHIGDDEAIEQLLATVIAGGHCLIQGAPGLGKTRLLQQLATCCSLDFKRIQGTPDLMPSDITGSEIYNQSQGNFEFEPGPIFSQLCMFDELNRATPRTQSALLQAMEESQVSAARTTHQLPSPFIVVSTQNPIELEGTFPLPEAQLDRFLTRIDLRQPSTESLVKILRLGPNNDTPNLAASSLLDIQAAVHDIAIADDLVRQVAELTTATHSNDNIQFGVSPRGALSIISLAKGFAFLRDQQHVQPLDIQNAVLPCLRHRITLAYHAAGHESCSDDILIEILSAHPIS